MQRVKCDKRKPICDRCRASDKRCFYRPTPYDKLDRDDSEYLVAPYDNPVTYQFEYSPAHYDESIRYASKYLLVSRTNILAKKLLKYLSSQNNSPTFLPRLSISPIVRTEETAQEFVLNTFISNFMRVDETFKNFWTSVVPKFIFNEPCVAHVFVALAARCRASLLIDQQSLYRSQLIRVCNKHYMEAWKFLVKPEMSSRIDIVLLCCLLSINLEAVQDTVKNGFLHLRSGLNMLRKWKSRYALKYPPAASSVGNLIEKTFEPIFLRFEAAASLFIHHITEILPISLRYPLLDTPKRFENLAAARGTFYDITLQDLSYGCSSLFPSTFSSNNRSIMKDLYEDFRFQFGKRFIKMLLRDFQRNQIEVTKIKSLASPNSLTHVIEDFALRLGQHAPSTDLLLIMGLTSNHRVYIAIMFEMELSWTYLMSQRISEDNDYIDEFIQPVRKHPAYQWLLQRIQMRLSFAQSTFTSMDRAASAVRQVLPSIATNSQTEVTFILAWSLLLFAKIQLSRTRSVKYDIRSVVTLTGQAPDIQAMTCSAYVAQIWGDNGIALLELLEDNINSEQPSQVLSKRRKDGAVLTVWHDINQTLHAMVNGTSGVAAEVAEQLSWLGSTLRTAEDSDRVVACAPAVTCLEQPKKPPSSSLIPLRRLTPSATYSNQSKKRSSSSLIPLSPLKIPSSSRSNESRDYSEFATADQSVDVQTIAWKAAYKFIITFKTTNMEAKYAQEGMCWRRVLHSVAFAQGYPTRPRPRSGLGIELPISLMARLVDTNYYHEFSGHLFIKGYSALYVAVHLVDDILVWHLHSDASGKRLPYPEFPKANVQLGEIFHYRHIVGWCGKVQNRAGASTAEYNVYRSKLPNVPRGGILYGLTLSAGREIPGVAQYTVMKDHQSLHMVKRGISRMLRDLSEHFILFWDVASKRGWVINGVDALLHLLRASLKLEEAQTSFLLDWTKLQEPQDLHGPGIAEEFLSNDFNRSQKISQSSFRPMPHAMDDKTDYESVGDRIQQIYEILEKAIDYQIYAERREVSYNRPMESLEGWDFGDIARQVRIIDPRVQRLPPVGQSYINMLRSLNTVALFGANFGELLIPSSMPCCNHWKTLPMGKYYMAVTVADLKRIFMLRGDETSEPPLINIDPPIVLHSPRYSSQHCGCRDKTETGSNFIQTAWPKDQLSALTSAIQSHERHSNDAGALVFGHNPALGYYLSDKGVCIGVPSEELEEPNTNQSGHHDEQIVRPQDNAGRFEEEPGRSLISTHPSEQEISTRYDRLPRQHDLYCTDAAAENGKSYLRTDISGGHVQLGDNYYNYTSYCSAGFASCMMMQTTINSSEPPLNQPGTMKRQISVADPGAAKPDGLEGLAETSTGRSKRRKGPKRR